MILLPTALFLNRESERLKNDTATTIITGEKSFLSLTHLHSIISCYFQSLWSWNVPRGRRGKMGRKFIFDRYCYKLALQFLGLFFVLCFFFFLLSHGHLYNIFFFRVFQLGPSDRKSSDVGYEFYASSLSWSPLSPLPLYKLPLLDSHRPLTLCSWQESKRPILSLLAGLCLV